MASNNNTIMGKVWAVQTNDFQQRIPNPTQAGLAATISALESPLNRQYFNSFMDILINRIGMTYVRGQAYKNPLAVFKGGKLNYGSTIQEIVPKWIKAHAYDDADQSLLKMSRPEAQVFYHTLNRRDRYDISVTEDEVRQAFTDEFGLNNLIAQVLQNPINSDEYDEYRIMVQLFKMYDDKWGFFRVHTDTAPENEDGTRAFLRKLRSLADTLKFPSRLYNVADVPVFADPSELVLITTPDVKAAMDVLGLAPLFHLDKGEAPMETVLVDEFPDANTYAVLTTRDFFVCQDVNYQTTSFYNPQTLTTNYYLHHWGVYSCSPVVPAIAFTTAEATVPKKATLTVTGLQITGGNSVKPGDSLQLETKLEGSTDNDAIIVAPDSVTWELTSSDGWELNSRTFVDNYSVLHVQKSAKSGGSLHVKATSTYTNPSGETQEYTAEKDITIE